MAEAAEGSAGSDDACLFMSPEGDLFLRHADGNVEKVEGFNASRTADDDEEDERARAVPRASGAKRALLVGINYLHSESNRLYGCINDVENMSEFLQSSFGFAASNITVLRDDNPDAMPTKENILTHMRALVADAQPGDSLFFHYSGHGSQSRDWTFLEQDGQNETICPCDFGTNGQIIDDDLHDILCKPLPAGAQLFAVFDSCHSGTILDLPFVFVDHDSQKYSSAHKSDEGGFMSRHLHGWRGALTGLTGLCVTIGAHVARELSHQGAKYGRKAIMRALNTTKADVFCLSGCRDEQTSADTSKLAGEATGAMSYALIASYTQHGASGALTLTQLMRHMRDLLHESNRFTQMPQLTMGRESDTEERIII